jgi:hypothetical protein
MDTMRGILFLVVTLIIIVSIYYIVKMFKGRTPSQSPPSPSPSPSDQTGKISISDLKFERTLNPDKSNSKGDDDIVGYTIEYDEGINYKELSTNVTFTLGWKNNIGFTGNVVGFTIEHYVKGDDNGTYGEDPKQSIELVDPEVVNVNNFKSNEVSIKGNGEYSVVGENRFKISVIMNDNTKTELYDGTKQNDDSHGIKISKDELGATLSMTKPETVKYIPVTREFASTSVIIKKVKYSISNGNSSLNYAGSGSIYLIPAYSGVVGQHADTFFFKYELGGENQYLLENGTKGEWNGRKNRERDAEFDNNKHDNRMFVAFYDKNEDVTQLRAPVMGYGLGGKFLSSNEAKNVILIGMSENDTVNETEFKNSYWTFEEVKGDPVNCVGSWVVTDDGTTTGTKIEKFNLISAAINNGTCEASGGDTRETLVPVNCIGSWVVTDYGTTTGTKIEKFNLISEEINDGTCEASGGDTRETLVPVDCKGDFGACTPDGGYCGYNGKKTYEVEREQKNGGKACTDDGKIVEHGDKKVCFLGVCPTWTH